MAVVGVVQQTPRPTRALKTEHSAAAAAALPHISPPVAPVPSMAPAPAAPILPPGPISFALPMRTLTRVETVATERHLQFVDITDRLKHCLAESGVQNGFAVVFSRHTTAGVRINEHEPLLLEDMAKLLQQLVPEEAGYQHDDFTVRTVNLNEDERINGHSHCRSLLLGASETVPVAAGHLLLGRWQRIFLVELDGPNQRELIFQIVGA